MLLHAVYTVIDPAVVFGASPLVLFSRAIVAAVWFIALLEIWRCREAPMANQAMAAALALVVGQIALIYHNKIPEDTLWFFIAMAEVVLAMSVMRIFRWASKLVKFWVRSPLHGDSVEELYEMVPVNGKNGEQPLITYIRALVIVVVIGILYFSLSFIAVEGL